jgi:VWFA-related protein
MSRHTLLLCAAVIATAQQVEPVYRTGTQLVQVDVVVATDKGPVKGLTKDDFTLQDKGKPQAIAVFAMNERGADAGKATPLPANVASNRIGSNGATAKTATVILFDRINILEPQNSNNSSNSSSTSGGGLSGLAAGAQSRAGRQVLAVLASLRPSERVGLYSLFQDLTVVRDFTEDSGPLIEAAKRLSATPPKAADTPAEQAFDTKLRDALTPGQTLERTVRAEITQNAFRELARRLDGVDGRKTLIWITSNFPLTYGDDANRRAEGEAEVNNVASELSEANVALYAIDPRGTGTGLSAGNNSAPDQTKSKGGKSMSKLDDTTTQNAGSLAGPESMESIARETGGKSFINTNDISTPIREAIDSAEVCYTLGFYVDTKALDGKKHDLSVKLSKKAETSGTKLLFRKNYVANAHRQHPEIKELIADRLNANRIGVMAASAPAPNRPGVDAVQVRVDLKDLQFERRADKWFTSFDLALAIESGGEPKVSVSPNSLSLSDDQLRQGLAGGVTIDNTVPAPDKASTLRIVVQDKASGEAGSVRIPLPAK